MKPKFPEEEKKIEKDLNTIKRIYNKTKENIKNEEIKNKLLQKDFAELKVLIDYMDTSDYFFG